MKENKNRGEDTEKSNERQIQELEEAKRALLNILEDADEANKKLLDTQAELKKTIVALQKLDKQKDEFISIAAHELKTPLTSLIGFATLLESEKVINDREKVKKYLKIIKDDSTRLSKLVTDILDLSRIDLGTLKLYPTKLNLYSTLQLVKESFTPRLKEKSLFLKINCNKAYTFTTDKERFLQIVNNLITNAINYTEKGGITLMAKDGKDITILVSDTGVGISQEGIKGLFRRFYQVDSTLTRKIGGSGLGLAISKGIVEAMGGKLSVKSKVGKGTEFTIVLPKVISSKYVSLVKKDEKLS